MAMAVAPTSTILSLSAVGGTVPSITSAIEYCGRSGRGRVIDDAVPSRDGSTVCAELDALQSGLGDVGSDLLVGNLFIPAPIAGRARERSPGPGNA
jgi:hypothetical protein